jgi:phosphatidylserine decarboxylase
MVSLREAAERGFATLVSSPALSRLAGRLADLRLPPPILAALIRGYARLYGVNLEETAEPVEAFSSFNSFFTRRLRGDTRPIDPAPATVVSPSDSRLTGMGRVPEDGRLQQVKGRTYALEALLGSSEEAAPFQDGCQATLYLSPAMYHRFHSPVSGRVVAWRYVPGRLFPVNAAAVRSVDAVLTRNERVIVFLETEDHGPVAVVLVGAANVGRITLRFADLVTNTGANPQRAEPATSIDLQRGEEMGAFNLGSTIVLLVGDPALAAVDDTPGRLVRVGEALWRRR